MSASTPTLILVATLSAAIGAAAAHLFGPRDATMAPPGAGEVAALEPAADSRAELALVQAATADLERRLGALELARHSASRTVADPEGGAPDAERVAELERRLGALEERLAAASATRAPALPVNEEMKLQVAEALEEVRKDETVAKLTSRQEKEAEALDARLDKYRAALGLSEGQVSDLRVMFEERQRREREIVRLWRDGADDATLAAEKQDLTEDLSGQLAETLSPQQLEDFYTLQRAGRGK